MNPLLRRCRRIAPAPRRGFSLVEVVLALGIAAFCGVTMMGLITVGLKANHNSASQTVANGILSAVISDLRATPSTSASSPQYRIAIPSPGAAASVDLYFTEDGQIASPAAGDTRYRLTVSFSASSSGRSATVADLRIHWPAAGTATNVLGSVETFVALDRN